MPIGNPNAQTKATQKWQEEHGYTVKSFKIKKQVAESFAEACKRKKVSQAMAITHLMQEYAHKN